jgi:hypothetical protein
MKKRGVYLLLATMSVMMLPRVFAAQPDAGMVVKLDGKAFYGRENIENAQQEVQAFMKIQENDVVKLAPESKLAVVYFSNGRREAWSGPLVIKIGTTQSQPADGANNPAQPQVAAIPETALKAIKRISPLVDPAKLYRSGGAQVRGKVTPREAKPLKSAELTVDERGKIETAKRMYESLTTQADTDDILPEMYFFSILGEYDQFDTMKGLIDIMRKKQPANPAVDAMADWLTAQGDK